MKDNNKLKMNRNIFGWMMYDFANSSFTTIIVSVVYSVYFVNTVVGDSGDGTALWGRGMAISMILVALSAPIFGAVADFSRAKKKFLFYNTYLTIIFTALLFFVGPGDINTGLTFFIIANFGFNSANVFYNAFLPEIVSKKHIGKVSGWGWAIGYAGGLTSLLIALPLVHNAVRWVFPSVAIFFAIFSIFTFFWLSEFSKPSKRANYFRIAYNRIKFSVVNISKLSELKKFIFSYFLYNDAIITVITFGAVYGREEFAMKTKDLLVYFIIMQFSSMAGAFGFGYILDKIGAKKTITISLVLWVGAVIWAFFCRSEAEFYFVGLLAGLAMGSSQSCSRSMLAQLTPDDKSAEFFGFYAFSGKIAAIIGPLLYGEVHRITGSQRFAILSILLFLITGGIVLQTVKTEKGIQDAQNWQKEE